MEIACPVFRWAARPRGEALGSARARAIEALPPEVCQAAREAGLDRRPAIGGPSAGARPDPFRARRRARAKPVNRNAKRLLVYVLDVAATQTHNQVVIDLARRQRKPTGEWGPLRPWWYAPRAAHVKYDPEDRLLLALLDEAHHGISSHAGGSTNGTALTSSPSSSHSPARVASDLRGIRRFVLRKDQAGLVERLAKTGRLRLRRTEGEDDPPTMRWDDGQPWRFSLDIRTEMGGKRWAWRGGLRRGENRMDLAEPLVLLPGLLVLGVGRAARFDDLGVMPWILRLRYEKEITFVEPQQDLMLGRILAETRVPPTELVESMRLEEIVARPRPCLTLRSPRQNWGLAADKLLGELEFDYDGAIIPAGRTTPLAVSTELGLVIRRDPRTESSADIKLFELGFREAKDPRLDPGTLELPAKRMGQVSKDLVQAGWRVEAEGKLIRPAGEFKLALSTGIDWFDLDGGIDYGGQSVSLPELLSAARRGETMIELGDGSMGMLPEEWLKKYGMLADLGTAENGSLRFNVSQAGVLDALLANQTEIQVDSAFEKVRENLRQFEGVVSLDSPPGFHGELRPYQREGLGWLDYLQRFGFGGILADDMGLGKTIQVLALLQRRRYRRQAKGPTLAVVPRSLVFNWIQEASKFTPRLNVLDYTGPGRHSLREKFSEYDLIITTYGTLRTDIAELTNFEFDYILLDEAQAIKNAESQSAKAARLLRARHRLAISGTPIENHLGEIWSIFEFLNPGMLGSDTVFKRYASARQRLEPRRHRSRPPGQGPPAVHPSPHQGTGRQGFAREDRADPLLRHGSRAAPLLRRAARPLPRRPAAQGRRRAQPVQDRGPRGPPAASPGRLPSRADQPGRGHRAQRQARDAHPVDRRGRGGGAQGPGLLPVHQLPGDRPRSARPGEARLRVSRRPHPQPGRQGRAVPDRPGLPDLPHQPQGRRPGPEPDRRGIRLPA